LKTEVEGYGAIESNSRRTRRCCCSGGHWGHFGLRKWENGGALVLLSRYVQFNFFLWTVEFVKVIYL